MGSQDADTASTPKAHHESEGHGFSRANNSRVENPTALPKAGAQAQPERLNCFRIGNGLYRWELEKDGKPLTAALAALINILRYSE